MPQIRVAIQQRVIPTYRVPFLEMLAQQESLTLGVFAGQARPQEMIAAATTINKADYHLTHNYHILRNKVYFCVQPQLLTWVKSFDPQVLIVEANPRYISTSAAIRWMKSQQRAVIGWGLGVPQHNGAGAEWRNKARRRFLKQFDAIISYSRQGALEYQKNGIPPAKIFTAPNATEPKPLFPPPPRADHFANGKAVVLFVGRLQARKKLDRLIKVLARLPQELQPTLCIVGDGAILNELKELARQIYPQTEFWGALYGQALAACYQRADLFVLPGTGGLAVQQAMAYALPVIVAEGDGTQSDLITKENGWQVAPDDEEQLYQVLLGALQDPARLRKMGCAAYKTVQTAVNIEKMVSVFSDAIKKVTTESRRP